VFKLKTFASRIGRWRGVRIALAAGLVLMAAAGCGGGGGGGGGITALAAGATGTSTAGAPATMATGGSTSTTSAPASNATPIIVDAGPPAATGVVNKAYVSVTVCPPGSSANCQTIDHVILDTGSSGLRLVASVLSDRSVFKQQTDASNNPYAECLQFVSGFTWGSVKVADIRIGGETASSVPVQIIGDPDFGSIPSSCSSTGAASDSVASFGGNGLLGVGSFKQDCGSACAASAIPGTYYVCPGGGTCTPAAAAVTQQVANPVPRFANDNNGVLIQLPSIPASGATNVAGTLVFGIGTQSNNALNGAQVFAVDAVGNFTTMFNGQGYPGSFIDSGSNVFFLPNTLMLPACSVAVGFLCPGSTVSLSAVNVGTNGTTRTVYFSIADAEKEFTANPTATAFDNLGGSFQGVGGFDWGLTFFFGRNVFTAFEGASTPGGAGPYYAY
jgi:hypothetical protein